VTAEAAAPEADRASATTSAQPPEPTRTVRPLERVPRPEGDERVVELSGVTVGGLEARVAEWGPDGGTLLLTGQRPFMGLTARAGFRSDGSLDGTAQVEGSVALLGLDLAHAHWQVSDWDAAAPLPAPHADLRGTTVVVDHSALTGEVEVVAAEGREARERPGALEVTLPGDAIGETEPISPRIAEMFASLRGWDVNGFDVHRDAPVEEAPAFVSNEDLFFAPGRYGVDSPETAAVLDAAIRAALAGLFGPVQPTPPAPEPQPGDDGVSQPSASAATSPEEPTGQAPAEVGPTEPETATVGAGSGEAGAPGDTGAGGAAAGEEAEGTAPEEPTGDKDGPLEVEVLMPEAPTEPTPAAQARTGGVAGAARASGGAARDMPSASETTDAARGEVEEPAAETIARAQEAVAAELGERPPPSPEIVELADRIRTAIRENRPEDEDELLRTDPTDEARDAGATVTGAVEGQTEEVGGAYDEMGEPAQGEPSLTPQPAPEQSAAVPDMGADAAAAAPDPIPAEDRSLDADVAATDQRIDDSGIDTRVTQEIPDGPFQATRAARGELGTLAERTPAEIAAEEQASIDAAQADMATLQLEAMASMRAAREGAVGDVGEGQASMTGDEELTRDTVAQRAQAIFDSAEQRVETMLDPLGRTALQRWDTGLARLSREFNDTLDRVQRWIDERHSGAIGTLVAIGDAIVGLPGWVTREYNRAEREFGDGVADLLIDISRDVNTVIVAAQAVIQTARDDIDALFDQMEAEFPEWAAQERARFAGMLDGLDNQVADAQTGFVRDVRERAITAVNEAHAAVEAKREEAGGLIGQVISAIEEFIDDPARAIINGLLRLVGIAPGEFWALIAQIEQVIDQIAADPENFINNLVEGVKLGFQQFLDNFPTHLLTAFWNWLFSGLETPIPMPTSYDPLSLMKFALELMGITWPNIREILVRHVGPEAVELAEAAWDLLSVLIERGPEGVVEMVKEQLSPESIVGMILDAAIEYLVETLVVQVAQYLFSLLNPVGAVAQAVRLIYQVCAWIFRNAARIFSFVQAVVGGIADVIAGNISGMAATVERALVMMIVVAIDFLAGLLGLSGLPDEVAAVIERLREYVLSIVERIVVFFVERGRALLARMGLGGEEDQEGDAGAENDDDELGTTVRFSAAGEAHRLYFAVAGDDATLMVASVPTAIEDKLAEWRDRLDHDDPPDEALRAEARTTLGNLETVADEANADGDRLAALFLAANANPEDDVEPPSDDALESRQRAIAGMLDRLFTIFEGTDATDQWLADMADFLPGEGDTAMDQPYRDWALRIPTFTIGNEPGDERLWPVGTLDGTRSSAETYIAEEATHRLLLPYFQSAPGERTVSTGAFSSYVFVQGNAPHPVRRQFRSHYGDAAVTQLQATARTSLAASSAVDDTYKERLQQRIDRMAFHWDSPGGGRIEFPTERVPDHTRYRPLNVQTVEANGVRTVTYHTVTGQTFTSTTDSTNGLSISVTGRNLRFMSGRGVTEDSPAFRSNNGFDRSHIIANEFGGTGFAVGGNLVTASSQYNQGTMRDAERSVGDAIGVFARTKGLDATTVSFEMTVTVSFGALRDPAALAQVKQQSWFPADRAGADLDAEITAMINAGEVHPDLMRITSVVYTWTFTDPSGGGGTVSIGPDLWLLTNG